jgi:hypothetical protein
MNLSDQWSDLSVDTGLSGSSQSEDSWNRVL